MREKSVFHHREYREYREYRKHVTIQPQTCPPLEDSHRPVRLWRINADRFKYKEITEEGELLKIEDLWNR